MKRYFNLILSLTIVALFTSCIGMMEDAQDVPIIGKVNVAYKVSATTAFIPATGEVTPDPNFSTAGLPVEFTELTTQQKVYGETDSDGVVSVELIPGEYSILVAGKVEKDGQGYYLNGTVPSVSLVKEITKQEALKNPGIVIRPAKVGGLVLAEIYTCGTRYTAGENSGSTWFRDQTYHINNNGDKVEYLDGICFAQLHPNIAMAGSALPRYPESEGLNNYVYGLWIWQFPGKVGDKNLPLNPGETVVICQEARNHLVDETDGVTVVRGNSVDNSNANFELWSGNETRKNTAVPDMVLCYAQYLNKMQYLASVMGGAFCLFTPDDGTVIDTDYYEDDSNLQADLKSNGQLNTSRYGRISASWIIDGVEMLGDMSLIGQKRIPAFVDAGVTSVGATYISKAVSRKVIDRRADGTPIFADTNNSTSDFEMVDPAIRRAGQKAPAWN